MSVNNEMVEDKKITFILGSLSGGGFEGVCVNLANGLAHRGWTVDLVCLNLKKTELLSKVSGKVNLINLNVNKFSFCFFPILNYIIKNNVKLIVCFHYYFASILVIHRAILKNNFKIVARNNISLSSVQEINSKSLKGRLIFSIVRRLYPLVDHVISQCDDMKEDLISNFKFDSNVVSVIYNPVNEKIENEARIDERNEIKPYILFVGRLAEQKRVHIALRVFASISDSYEEIEFKIVGQGSNLNELKRLSEELGIGKRVKFEGFQEDLSRYYCDAHLTVLTSSFEGFPNVLVESITLGTPVISFDCPTGPREIIEEGINGFLVENNNINMFRSKMLDALNLNWDSSLIKKTSIKYRSSVIFDQYERLFYGVMMDNLNEK